MASDTFRAGAPGFDVQKRGMRKTKTKAKAILQRDFIIVDAAEAWASTR
jgi:hypothetical protein